MDSRELHKQKYQAQLHEWEAKLSGLKASLEKSTAQAKLGAKPHVDAAEAACKAARSKLHDMTEATGDAWDEVARGIKDGWNEFEAAVTGAYDALKEHEA